MLQKNFDTLATSLSVLHNYFDGLTKFQQTLDSSTNFYSLLKYSDLLLRHMIYMTTYTPKNLRKRIPKDIRSQRYDSKNIARFRTRQHAS